ncbi:MAG: Txe/YoeB family addiction module toxin [Sphingobacteriaceae bacterium]|nr:MAG: Txe/YoeB family addiction module toxin [Sphingobacteriaceae bacterium]
MEVKLLPQADEDLLYWQKSGNKAILKKIAQLIRAMNEDPYYGIGKPEQLKHKFTGFWSRRIDREHRIVYEVKEDILTIYSLRGHYD